jgi:hypothetical protein
MKKQFSIPFTFFLLGMAITIIGALFKLMHWPGANRILIVGMITEAFAILTLIITILKKK